MVVVLFSDCSLDVDAVEVDVLEVDANWQAL